MSRTHGTAELTCKNHPSYRWTRTKYVHPKHKGPSPYIGRGVLMFDGEEGGKPSCPFSMSERRLAETSPEFEAHYREHYTPECNCPYKDLVFLRWLDD